MAKVPALVPKIVLVETKSLSEIRALNGSLATHTQKIFGSLVSRHPPNTCAREVPLIDDIRLTQCCVRFNRLNPLTQTSKFQKGQEPVNDPAQTPTKCGAKTRSGVPCAKFPIEGKRRCRLHGGLSTGPKTVAGKAAISAANTKHGRYKNWREKQAKERYYRGEIKRVMRGAREAGFVK